jgi:hypothetical protein
LAGRKCWAAMHPIGERKCLSCEEFFKPDARNRRSQRYCRKPACRKASKVESQRRWLEQQANQEYFAGAENTARVQAWRRANPGYSRKKRKLGGDALQDLLNPQTAAAQEDAKQDDGAALQDHWQTQPAVVIGLIAHLTGVALQEDIASMTGRLIAKGQALMSQNDAPKTNTPSGPIAAGAGRI